jgi:hypothetical protein
MSVDEAQQPAGSRAARVSFWTLGVLSVLFFAAAWFWVALAFGEEWSEEPKAQAAGTTVAGTGLWMALIPVLVVHVVACAVAAVLAVGGWGAPVWRRILLAVPAVIIASLPGFLLWMLLSPGGSMFAPPPFVP